MLQELHVRNFALIDQIRLAFGPGLNVLTGETGAGKSILIDALGLVLGGRASSDMVRQGADKAIVETLFSLQQDDNLYRFLQELGIESEDGTLVIVRELSSAGKTVARVNGRMVTVQILRQIGSMLVDLAGQHEHQSLLRTEEHLTMFDAFGGKPIAQLRDQVKTIYEQYRAAKQSFEQASIGEQERIQRMDMLRFQLEEIRGLGLKPGEEDQLEEEQRKLSAAEKLFSVTSSAFESLYQGGSKQTPIVEILHKTSFELENLLKYDSRLESVVEIVKSSAFQLEEAAHELRAYRDNIEFNPEKLNSLEERLAVLSRLRRKYGETVAEIVKYAERIEHELHQLEHHEENLGRLEQQQNELEQRLAEAASRLSAKRKSLAKTLSKQIVEELSTLMMPRTRFEIEFQLEKDDRGIRVGDQRVHVNETGIDRVEFLFSANDGEPVRPLAKIASGGELSRTLLALKAILSGEGVNTLIFDEIDTGISGRAAQAVAEKMSVVSETNQVICVTHLPQVACMADTHFMIVKQQQKGRPQTILTELSETERIEELARMLSGAELTDTTRKHAKEMLVQAQQIKTKAV